MFHLKKKKFRKKYIFRPERNKHIVKRFPLQYLKSFQSSPRVECSVSLVIAQEPNEARKLKYIIKD